MSARIIPLSVLSFVLLAIFCAVVATAQEALNPSQQVGQTIQQNPLAQGIQQVVGEPQPPAQAPFTLTPEEEANLDRLLSDWQTMSAKVKTFEAGFNRWDYDGVFGNGTTPKKFVRGSLKYAAPDKGFYDLEDHSEKWICTGDAIFEFRADVSQVREHRLPANMRGKAISDGPLPFVFGVEAAKMKARYWMRITTPHEAAQKSQVWIEAYPKFSKDAANFSRVDVILSFIVENGTVTKLEPYAINLVMPNQKDRTAYQFTSMTTNGVLNNINEFFGLFVRPATPLGWKHQLMDEGMANGAEPAPATPPAGGVGSAPQPTVPR